MAAATKANTEVDDWTAAAKDTVTEGSAADVSTTLDAALFVTVVHTDANANALGVLVTVQGRFGAEDEDWRDLYTLRMGAGTASTTTINDADVNAAETTITITAGTPTTGERWWIEDGTLVNSEVVTTTSKASTTWTVLDGLANDHADGLSIFDTVAEKLFPLPNSVSTARVVFANDDADAEMAFRVDLAEMSAIA